MTKKVYSYLFQFSASISALMLGRLSETEGKQVELISLLGSHLWLQMVIAVGRDCRQWNKYLQKSQVRKAFLEVSFLGTWKEEIEWVCGSCELQEIDSTRMDWTAGGGFWGGGTFRECLARTRNSNTKSDPYYQIK